LIRGNYYRYSDDILIIVPGGEAEGLAIRDKVCSLIRGFGSRIQIKENKSSIFVFASEGDHQIFRLVSGEKGRNGLEYLGFRYDGQQIFIRDATISNLLRKVVRATRREANALARRYPDKDVTQLKKLFDYDKMIKKFGRVEDFDEKQHDFRNWTFWSYATRAADLFGPLGKRVLRQLLGYRTRVRTHAELEIDRAVARRDRR
jgi:hypothetical protein